MFVAAAAGPVAPLLITLYIDVYPSNQTAFSQDSLFRGYAHRWERKQRQAALAASLWLIIDVTTVEDIMWVFYCFRFGLLLSSVLQVSFVFDKSPPIHLHARP